MTPELLDTLEITQLLEEVKRKLTSVEEKQDTTIGHLEALEAMLSSARIGFEDKESFASMRLPDSGGDCAI